MQIERKYIEALKITLGQLGYGSMMLGKAVLHLFLGLIALVSIMGLFIFIMIYPWISFGIFVLGLLVKLFLINLEFVEIWEEEDEQTGEETIQERTQESGKDQSVH